MSCLRPKFLPAYRAWKCWTQYKHTKTEYKPRKKVCACLRACLFTFYCNNSWRSRSDKILIKEWPNRKIYFRRCFGVSRNCWPLTKSNSSNYLASYNGYQQLVFKVVIMCKQEINICLSFTYTILLIRAYIYDFVLVNY